MTTATPSTPDTRVVRAAIHPAIGIARVGDSRDEFYFGPEVCDPPSEPPGYYKDKTGALKRQAARFRVYGYNAAGEVVAELTAATAEIEWTVHVANTKAAWYQFQIALDIPEANLTAPAVDPSLRRNATVAGADRAKLVIDPGPRSVRGANQSGTKFDTGKFFNKKVYLGELRTDAAGRLVFLGGHGVSASHDGTPAVTFANNDGWHDDVSDGPVTAVVKVDGVAVPCDPAWVVVGPPNYAPDLKSVRTMYDLLRSVFVEASQLPDPPRASFRNDVLPVLTRLHRLQWVNQGFAAAFGWKGAVDLTEPGLLDRLAAPGDEFRELRRQVCNQFRVFDRDGVSPVPWPWLYGDSMSLPPISPRQNSVLSPLQMRLLALWVAGKFDDDRGCPPPPTALDQVEVARQPATLDAAALDYCLADAFHPGCEITWPVRHVTMFDKPFRVKHRPAGDPEPDYGRQLTPAEALAWGGPLYAQGPGDLSRWMAVPWQTDTASCLSGYDKSYDPFLPTFWPARVPNQVLTAAEYAKAVKAGTPAEQLKHFNTRADWYRDFSPDYRVAINQMVAHFGALGVVEAHPRPAGDTTLPPVVYVESKPGPIAPPAAAVAAAVGAAPEAAPVRFAEAEKVRRFR
ncbi:MAG TPA: LodA/GoxA family CTQ-dependent oxidase [Urbifossiella sp.]|nr:LodA/GoxA family CTQ-dependent oxidase [Urbifossiella sp.]